MSKIAQLIARKVEEKREALGNSNRGLKHLACDYLHDDIGTNQKRRQVVANNCFLNIHTIERVMDCEENYRPMSDTVERILRYYGVRLTATEVAMKSQFQNKPKHDLENATYDDIER
jgi:hypothetical protein